MLLHYLLTFQGSLHLSIRSVGLILLEFLTFESPQRLKRWTSHSLENVWFSFKCYINLKPFKNLKMPEVYLEIPLKFIVRHKPQG